MSYLLRNESFLPVASLYLLGLGLDDGEILEALADGSLKKRLQEVLENSDMEFDVMLSARHLSSTISSERNLRDQVNATPRDSSHNKKTSLMRGWLRRLSSV